MQARALRGRPLRAQAARARSFPRLALLSITLLAFALRVLTLQAQSLWRDEVDALLFATRPLPQLLDMFRQPGQNGPLFFLALRPWLALAGHSEFALRFPSALLGALPVPILYHLTAPLLGRRVALVAALLMATAPYGVWYGQEAKMYALLTVLAPASLLVITALRANRSWRPWVALYVLTSLAAYTHLLAVLVVPVQLLWLVVLPWSPRLSRRLLAAGAYAAGLALPYVPFLKWAPGVLTSAYSSGYPFVPLGDILKILAGAFSRGVLGISPATLLPYMLALVAGVILWPMLTARKVEGQQSPADELDGRGRRVLLLLLWLLLPPILIYLVSLRVPVFTDRYVIWAMPAFLALLACGIDACARWWRPLGLILVAVILALNAWSVYLQASQPIKSDFRSAAGYVVARYRPGDVIMYQIPYSRYTFTYYASGKQDPEDVAWRGVEGPYTNHGMSADEADAWIATRIGGAHVVWLVLSETAMWDQRDLTVQWFAANTTETERADFARVSVVRYER